MIRKWCIILLLVFILTEIANHVQSLEQSPNSVTLCARMDETTSVSSLM